MATWKKVIVSGSSANLANLQVDSLSSGLVTGASGNLTTTAINGTGDIVATTNATGLQHSGSFSGSFEGDGSGLTGVVAQAANALTDGAGIIDFSYDGNAAGVTVSVDSGSLAGDGLTTSGGAFDVQADGSTIAVGASGIKVADGEIGTTQIADSLGNIDENSFTGSFSGSFIGTTDLPDLTDGNGIADFTYDGSSTATIAVQADGSTIAVGSGGIKVADGQIGTTQIADSLGNIDENSFTGSFSGSFTGDGSGLTGLATTLTFDGDSGGTSTVDLQSQALDIAGTSNEIETSVSGQQLTIGLPDDVTIGQDLTVTRDLVVSRNLTVSGTASFQHTEDLDVADRFIRMASGSTSAGDGGIVIQQTSALDGEVFGFDSATTRFGVSGSFDASQNAFTPDAFMAAAINTAGNDPNGANAPDARYEKKGNLYVASDSEDIWIYS